VAAFNLGVALEDQGRDEEALAAYSRALQENCGLADAHFNASLIEERAGSRTGAFRHSSAYRRLTNRACERANVRPEHSRHDG
jgi:hypothetical protein